MDLPQILFSFTGRINRMPYWLVGIGLGFAAGIIVGIATWILPQSVATVGVAGVCIACLWISLAMGVKRAHDRGRSGWFLLVGLVPLLNLWPLVELYFLRGTVGQNQYGPDPLGG